MPWDISWLDPRQRPGWLKGLAYAGVAEGRIVTRGEQELWTQHYLECCSELHQWGTVSEYASSTSNLELAQTALCKLQDWASLKDILPMASVRPSPSVPTQSTV